MKVLWLCNTCPAFVSDMLGQKKFNNMGWLDSIGNKLIKTESLCVVYPSTEVVYKDYGQLSVYSFMSKYNKKFDICSMKNEFEKILTTVSPDLIHIQGTEFPHSYAMTMAARSKSIGDRVIISIQGLVSVYAKHYYSGMPLKVILSTTIRDLIKRDNIFWQKRKFEKRGKFEILAISNCSHIIGRTDWDRACAQAINAKAHYHFCNEALRKSFYDGQWQYEKCEKQSIFVSQSSYPIKGLHVILDKLSEIRKDFPNVKVYVTGTDPFSVPFYKIGTYQRYLKKLIQKNKLRDSIVFLGSLNEKQMREQYLKANVFLLCSSIENSPNSLGEAMILGVPIVAANVGGVRNLGGNTEVSIYPFDEPYMLPYYICSIFSKGDINNFDEIAMARNTHDEMKVFNTLIDIYKIVINSAFTPVF